MTDRAPASAIPNDHWVARMGIDLDRSTLEHEGPVIGAGPDLGPLTDPLSGRPRLGALATIVDFVAGCSPTGPVTPTLDLRVRLLDTVPRSGPLTVAVTARKVGRSFIHGHTELTVGDGTVIGIATTTFMNRPIDVALSRFDHPQSTIAELDAIVAADEIDDATLSIDPGPILANGVHGTVQGGAQAYLAELAALRVAGAASHHVVDMDIRFLNRFRAAPLRARATQIGTSAGGSVVEVILTDGAEPSRIQGQVTLALAPVR